MNPRRMIEQEMMYLKIATILVPLPKHSISTGCQRSKGEPVCLPYL